MHSLLRLESIIEIEISNPNAISKSSQLAKAIREVSGCKLFAIEYAGPVTRVRTLEITIDYRPYILIAVTTIAILTSIYIITRRYSS